MSEGNGSAALLGYPEEWSEDQAAIDDLDSRRFVDEPAAALGAIKGIATRALSRDAAMHTLLVHAAKDHERIEVQGKEILGAIKSLREHADDRIDGLSMQLDFVSGLAYGTAAKVGVNVDEHEQMVTDVRRLRARAAARDAEQAQARATANVALETARAAKASADDSHQRAILAGERAAAAVIEEAKAKAALDVMADARRSHHDDDHLERIARQARGAERRARRWQLIVIVLGALATLGGGVALFEWQQQRARVEVTGPSLKVR